MNKKIMLLLLLSAAGRYASAQSRTTITTPSKNRQSSPTYSSNLPKKAPVIDTKAPKIGETLCVLEDFPSVQLPATPRPTVKEYCEPTTQYSNTTTNNGNTTVQTTTQRSANGSSTMTVTTYSVRKTYAPVRTQPVRKTVVSPNQGRTTTVYASATPPKTNTIRVKNTVKPSTYSPQKTYANAPKPSVTTAPTTVRTAIHTPVSSTSASSFSESQRAAANTGAYANYLSSEEKRVLQLINLARTDGNLFLKEYADKYIASNPVFQNNKFAQSLYTDLRRAKGLPALTPNEKLFRSAKAHASDIGSKGLKGHNSSSGESFSKRIPRFLSNYSGFGENISYGTDNNNAIPIVMLLLIDNNNPDYGHRKNILSPAYETIGASIQQHKKYGYLCVQDFGTDVE